MQSDEKDRRPEPCPVPPEMQWMFRMAPGEMRVMGHRDHFTHVPQSGA